jgi:hypothetical protein
MCKFGHPCGATIWQVMDKLLDRKHLEEHQVPPYPETGVGYEVVAHSEGSGMSLARLHEGIDCHGTTLTL